MIRAAFGIAATSCLVAIVVLSWLPRQMEIRTGFAGQSEHVVAYLGTAILARLAWPRHGTASMAAAFVALAILLEIGQIWVPGRNAQVIDVAAGSLGAVAGLLACALVLRRVSSRNVR